MQITTGIFYTAAGFYKKTTQILRILFYKSAVSLDFIDTNIRIFEALAAQFSAQHAAQCKTAYTGFILK